ncbi:uncharacterized protein Jvl isoform X1 [Diachasmimorpha longicaudata]|uniref:uncharacterized protein Jvl isoform X1 n=2 Tax=Diachasmimorpha longicaudata TaxID=58733 RepID=UPI0030B89F54
MSREFYVPCTPYAYPQCGGPTDGVVVSNDPVGMDCMPLRPGPFHYLISEQAKSLVALQELQNEVGALLEFRDLVIETFPNLRHKMAVSATASVSGSVMSSSNQSSHIPLPLSSPSSRRIGEWEPGKVRRRIAPRDGDTSSSSLPRSRSNSHSGGSKNSGTVQDSGFSTETSSKDSASTAIPRPASPKPVLDEAEDELWNLLDVIHRKGIRLREEVESLQGRLESVAPDELGITDDVLEAVKKVTDNPGELSRDDLYENDHEVTLLKREKEQLLDKVAELEAETISSRTRAQELQLELAALSAIKSGLEDRLRAGLEGDSEIVVPSVQRKPVGIVSSSPLTSPKHSVNIRSKSSAFASVGSKAHKNRFRTRTIEKNVLANGAVLPGGEDVDPEAAAHARRIRLGALDSVLVSPTRIAHIKNVDSGKIAAILRERSPLELQRHLITTTVHNQCLQNRLDEVKKSTETLSDRLDKVREENDELRYQLEERNIELEGTRARVRVLEKQQQRPSTEPLNDPDSSEVEPRCEPSCLEPGSSTESARDHHQIVEVKPSPRRRPPSRIPLPGTKPTAPRPPTKSDSRESLKTSLKSLTKPTRDSSRESNNDRTKSSLTKNRDSSRESLSKSLPKTGKDTSRESLSKSLPRNNSSRDSLNKSSLSRARDSLETNNHHYQGLNHNYQGINHQGMIMKSGTVPRRPVAPARRSHSLARASVDTDTTGKALTDPPTSWCSSTSFRHSESSLYPDSLNQDSSLNDSTKIEFIIGSPTRRFRPPSAWQNSYFDSIESSAMAAESLSTGEFPLRGGEALAECDSLECHPIFSEG